MDETSPALIPPSVSTLGFAVLRNRMRAMLLDEPQEEVRVGRFALQRELGRGGMGTVWLARDEELDRSVALKFLHPTVGELGDLRLYREAQGLAKLSHPNVIPVFDVGRQDGRVWLAMEYVEGRTLRAWQDREPSRRTRLRAWLDAGRGLAAVHRAGLVHRDVKPDNVLMGDDGRVRVVDFGLVRALPGTPGAAQSLPQGRLSELGSGPSEEGTTDPGIFVGTPAYAPPEQRRGLEVDARADQFSFCMSVWESLCEERVTMDRWPTREGQLIDLPRGARMSRRVRKALSRGLQTDPERRFVDMNDLLDRLEPRGRRWALGGTVAAGLMGLGVGLASASPDAPAEPIDPCAQSGKPIERVWTAAHRETIGQGFAPEVSARAQSVLDEWTQQWADAAQQTCEDVHVSRRYSEASLDSRGLCLDRSLDGLEALAEALDAGRVTSPAALTEWLGVLDDPQACLGEAILASEYERASPEQQAEVEEIRRTLVETRVGAGPGRMVDRVELAEQALGRAIGLGWPPIIGEAALALGRLQLASRDREAARRSLGQALDIGQAARDTELAANAWSALNRLERVVESDPAGARWTWERQAALFETVEPSPRRRARLLYDRGQTERGEGDLDRAESTLRQAQEVYATLGPAVSWEHASLVRDLANLLSMRGQTDEARELMDRARSLEVALGTPSDADRGRDEGMKGLDEGINMLEAGKAAEAADRLAEALEAAIARDGPRGELVARVHIALAATHDVLGDSDAFGQHAERADEISLLAVGPDHLLRIDVLSAVGAAALADGRHEVAMNAFERAVVLARRHRRHDSIQVALAERNLAEALHAVGKDARAEALIGHVLPILERDLSNNHPALMPSLETLAEIHLSRHEPELARTLLLRARAIAQNAAPGDVGAIDELLSQVTETSHPTNERTRR